MEEIEIVLRAIWIVEGANRFAIRAIRIAMTAILIPGGAIPIWRGQIGISRSVMWIALHAMWIATLATFRKRRLSHRGAVAAHELRGYWGSAMRACRGLSP